MPSTSLHDWPRLALRLAREQGFALAGLCPAQPVEESLRGYFRGWLAQGRHGEMHYLARHIDQRLDPRLLLPGAQSILCVADHYAAHRTASRLPPPASGLQPLVARYAWGRDYHRVMKSRLFKIADALRASFPDHQFRVAVDTAPIMERQHAARAGLGWIGKNTLLLNPRLGSYLLLGEIVMTLALPAPAARTPEPSVSHCGSCTRCIDACPTHCLTPYRLDARRCVSYLTLEHRSAIAPDLHAPIGHWFAGCDICQDVCPFNQRQSPEDSPCRPPAYSLLDILSWDAPARRHAFRNSALKRLKLDMARRNALIAAGNYLASNPSAAPAGALLGRIRTIAGHSAESQIVRTTAQQTLNRWHASEPGA